MGDRLPEIEAALPAVNVTALTEPEWKAVLLRLLRTDVPWLIAEVKRLRGENEHGRFVAQSLVDAHNLMTHGVTRLADR